MSLPKLLIIGHARHGIVTFFNFLHIYYKNRYGNNKYLRVN
jgi:hypothetical protein